MTDRVRLAEIARRQQEGRPVYFDDPKMDHLLSLLLELAEEVCVHRDRVATARLLAQSGQAVTDAAIDRFEPDDDERVRRLEAHRELYRSLLRRVADG